MDVLLHTIEAALGRTNWQRRTSKNCTRSDVSAGKSGRRFQAAECSGSSSRSSKHWHQKASTVPSDLGVAAKRTLRRAAARVTASTAHLARHSSRVASAKLVEAMVTGAVARTPSKSTWSTHMGS